MTKDAVAKDWSGLLTEDGGRLYSDPTNIPSPGANGDVAALRFNNVIVARDASSATKLAAFDQWNNLNSEPTDNACGWVYTNTYANIGISNPPSGNTRGLVQEFYPISMGTPGVTQPDPFLQWGGDSLEASPPGHLPANVWIRFWVMLVETFDADIGDGVESFTSTVSTRDKSFYPSREAPEILYNATFMDGLNWDHLMGSGGYEGINEHLGVPAMPRDEMFQCLDTGGAAFGGGADNQLVSEGDQHKLYQNLNNTTGKIVKGVWTEVTHHMDTSGAGGTWECWIKKEGQARVKVAEWIHGTTEDFTWSIPVDERVGHRVFRLNAVINGSSSGGDHGDHMLVYDTIDIATAEVLLPDYDA